MNQIFNLRNYSALSVAATALVLGFAWQKVHEPSSHLTSQDYFYGLPWFKLTGVLVSDKFCVAVLVNMVYTLLFIFGKGIQWIVFGKLRVIESQHLYDRLLNFALFKLVFIVFILEPSLQELFVWTAWFSIIGFLRIFSMLSRDRFEYLTFSPNTPSRVHIRLLGLIVLILFSDLLWFLFCVSVFSSAGISVVLLLTFECLTLFLDTLQTLVKYAIHLKDISVDGVWENRSMYSYYTEFFTDFLIHIATLGHYLHIFKLHGVQFTMIDCVLMLNMRSTFISLRKKIEKFRNYRLATNNLQSKYPNATPEELNLYNDDCAICREKMSNAKILPCKHLFHASCLRSWLEQHGTCPTCRRSLITSEPLTTQPTSPLPPGMPDAPANEGAADAPVGNDENSLFQFHGRRWASWLPNFSVEVVRRPTTERPFLNPEALNVPRWMVDHIREIFPHVPEDVILQDLARTNSVDTTSENILDGRLFFVPLTPIPPSRSNPDLSAPSESTLNSSLPQPSLSENQLGASSPASSSPPSSSITTTTTSSVPAAFAGSTAPNSSHLFSETLNSSPPSVFPSSAEDRHNNLLYRKKIALENSRRRFLESQTETASPAVDQPVPPVSVPPPVINSSSASESLGSSFESRVEMRRRALEAAQRRIETNRG
eukprot:Sdes_comp19260_c0_seq1m10244